MNLDKLIAEALARFKDNFDEPVDIESESYRAEIIAGLFELLRVVKNPEELSVLDIGVGKGWSSFVLSHYFKHANGIDIQFTKGEVQSNRINEALQAKMWGYWKSLQDNVQYEFFDGYNIPVPDASQDVVVAIAVLEHVGDEAKDNACRCAWLREVNRVLKPEGILYISECPTRLSTARR